MSQANILVVCATTRDRRELTRNKFNKKYNIHFQEYDEDIIDKIICGVSQDFYDFLHPEQMLKELLVFCKKNDIQAVVSSDDYPGNIYASIINHHLGLCGPHPEKILNCQHKYYSRVNQKKFVPEATPDFILVDPYQLNANNMQMPFPLFLKPVKSYFSVYANKISDISEFKQQALQSLPPELFLQAMNWFLKHYTAYDLNANYLLAESLLEGMQVTLEGYSFNGKVKVVGIVDSIMYPGTMCFQRFQYPSCLPERVQQRMNDIAITFIESLGLDNTLFNIEFMYNQRQESIHIIEINPRMCSQFADLYEKVDGIDTYQVLIDLALGNEPEILIKKGDFKVAASFALRCFTDKLVIKNPNPQQVKTAYQALPEMRLEIHAKEGEYLSSLLQDGKSYRYALIHLGGEDLEDLFAKFERSKDLLPFEFK
jgi:hypothetical protein